MISPPLSVSTSQDTLPSSLIDRIDDPTSQLLIIRFCKYDVFADMDNAPTCPPPINPFDALTDVISPPLSLSNSHSTVPFSYTTRIDDPDGHVAVIRDCTVL